MKVKVSREQLEQYQVLVYLGAVLAGAGAGFLMPGAGRALEVLVWPILAALLYTTFCQVQPSEARRAFRHHRFFAASLLANFLLVPCVVWLLSWLLPPDPAIRLGVFLVLLVPCTDWFVTFTHLGRGNTRLAVAVVPVQLAIQFALLPLYLWVFLGREFVEVVTFGPFLQVFLGLIVVPFVLAAFTRLWASADGTGARWLEITEWLPVPFLAATIFLIAASHAPALGDALGALGWAALVFVIYIAVAAPLAKLIALAIRLNNADGRALAFNVGTRNSFVVLPLALALPVAWEAAVAAIVLQSLVELAGMLGYLWWVPQRLFPGTGPHREPV
jgi:arsenite transporter